MTTACSSSLGLRWQKAQRLRQELGDPEQHVLVVAEQAGVDDGEARAPVGAAVAPHAEQRFHAQRLAAGFKQRRVAVPQAVELRHQIAADAARGVHALGEVGQLRILLLSRLIRSPSVTSLLKRAPRMRKATDSVPDCF